MKKLLLAALFLIPFVTRAQSPAAFSYKVEDRYVYYGDVVKVDTSFKVADLYKDAKLFITKLALTNVNITTDDKNNGMVVVDVQEPGTYKNATGIGSEAMTLKYTIKLELKQGRYRYTFDNIVINYEEDGRVSAHTLYNEDKRSSGILGNPRSKRVLKAMDALFQNKIELLANTMNKKSDDF